ncbi:hypothetical protein KC730_01880, partial [Candidatus Kaiserbacteria bacterium]|nr:hypothetical protein [Candidatus Kaiserbacteria bacterium]
KFLSPVNSFLEKIIGGRFFSSLLLLKFLIGIRLILILHLARYPISWVRFILYDILGTLIYILILASISVYLSKFITSAIPAFHSLTTTLSGVLLIIILSAIAHQILLPKK